MSQETIVVESAIAKATEDLKGAMGIVAEPEKKAVNEDEGLDPKYQGKTKAEIVEMHRNAEARLGGMGQELGVWRGLVSDLSAKVAAPAATIKETAPKITSDELLTDPEDSISKVVRRELEAALKPVHDRQDLSARESDLAALNRDFPTMNQIGDDPQFRTWVTGARGRSADAALAAKGDTNAARRLLESWTDRQSFATKAADTTDTSKKTGIDGARAAATESGGSGGRGTPSGKIFHKSEVVDLIIKNPDLYNSDGYQRELLLAAKEGRLQ
jgi:hypothetical protein